MLRIFFPDDDVTDLETRRRSVKWRSVGEYLHALEDSYSHQRGRYKRDFTRQFGTLVGHAKWGHTADHTWRRPELAMEMAKDTFDTLVELCQESHQGRACRSSDWSLIKDTVERFVRYDPGQHGELGWEFIHTGGSTLAHGYIWNVTSYAGKIGVLRLKYQQRELDVRNRTLLEWAEHERKYPMSNSFSYYEHMKIPWVEPNLDQFTP